MTSRTIAIGDCKIETLTEPEVKDIVAMREQQESMRKLKEKYPGWGEE